MVNAKSFFESPEIIYELFSFKDESLFLWFVLLLILTMYQNHFILLTLLKLGYEVAINLMQSHGKTDKEYHDTIESIKNEKIVDIIYFADSLGNMHPNDVYHISNIFRMYGKEM